MASIPPMDDRELSFHVSRAFRGVDGAFTARPTRAERGFLSDIDDLNRVTLSATCEILPLCRERNVTLLVRLASETMHVRGDSRLLEVALVSLLEGMSYLAQITTTRSRVEVTTTRRSAHAELEAVASRSGFEIDSSQLESTFGEARTLLEPFGGSLKISLGEESFRVRAILPLHIPGRSAQERIGIDEPERRPSDVLSLRAHWNNNNSGPGGRKVERGGGLNVFERR